MCTSHPKKGDLPEFDGLSAEQEDTHERACRAQLGSVLHHNTARHICFSKQLLRLADPHFVASPPPTPRRKKTKRDRQPQVPHAAQASHAEENPEEEMHHETRNLEDLAAFFAVESDGENSDY